MRVIDTITIAPDNHLCLTYTDGVVIVVDFKPLIAQGGVFAQLSDPDYFSQVLVGERGRYVQWPGDLDFCADALWLEAQSGSNTAA